MKNFLFICSANLRRSKTGEDYFAEQYPHLNFESAGTNIKMCQKEGTNPLSEELLEWADLIFLMEPRHQNAAKKMGKGNYGTKMKVLHIPDRFKYYQTDLIELFREKVLAFLEA